MNEKIHNSQLKQNIRNEWGKERWFS